MDGVPYPQFEEILKPYAATDLYDLNVYLKLGV